MEGCRLLKDTRAEEAKEQQDLIKVREAEVGSLRDQLGETQGKLANSEKEVKELLGKLAAAGGNKAHEKETLLAKKETEIADLQKKLEKQNVLETEKSQNGAKCDEPKVERDSKMVERYQSLLKEKDDCIEEIAKLKKDQESEKKSMVGELARLEGKLRESDAKRKVELEGKCSIAIDAEVKRLHNEGEISRKKILDMRKDYDAKLEEKNDQLKALEAKLEMLSGDAKKNEDLQQERARALDQTKIALDQTKTALAESEKKVEALLEKLAGLEAEKEECETGKDSVLTEMKELKQMHSLNEKIEETLKEKEDILKVLKDEVIQKNKEIMKITEESVERRMAYLKCKAELDRLKCE